MNYFIADLHFGSEEILQRENRPFSDIDVFQRYCYDLWNEVLNKNDTLYIIGDFINYNKDNKLSIDEIDDIFTSIKRIKANAILIIGNNEERIIKELFNNSFELFRDYLKKCGFKDIKKDEFISFEGENFYLNHYPSKHVDKYINLFGHTHKATGLWKPYGLNVGCDLNYFQIYSEDDIINLLKIKRKWWDNDIDNLCM